MDLPEIPLWISGIVETGQLFQKPNNFFHDTLLRLRRSVKPLPAATKRSYVLLWFFVLYFI